MGKLKSFEELNLERRLNKVSEELIQLKTKQRYGMNQVQSYQSNSVHADCVVFKTDTSSGTTVYSSGIDILKLRFTGDKPSKTVVAKLNIQINGDGQTYVAPTFQKDLRGASSNVMEWVVYVGGVGQVNPSWSVDFSVLSNENGLLSIAESHSIRDNYPWIVG